MFRVLEFCRNKDYSFFKEQNLGSMANGFLLQIGNHEEKIFVVSISVFQTLSPQAVIQRQGG